MKPLTKIHELHGVDKIDMDIGDAAWALRFNGEFEMFFPAQCPESTIDPKQLAMTACVLRCRDDPEFVKAQCDWFQEDKKS